MKASDKNVSYDELLKICNKNNKIMALDVSNMHIGIALSDYEKLLAFPYKTIKRTKFSLDLETLKKIILQNQVVAIIIGLPLDGDGTNNKRVQTINDFRKLLQAQINILIYCQDERFSTHFIKNNLFDNSKQEIDSQAAAWFLQIFLDKVFKNFINTESFKN